MFLSTGEKDILTTLEIYVLLTGEMFLLKERVGMPLNVKKVHTNNKVNPVQAVSTLKLYRLLIYREVENKTCKG